MRGRGRFGCGGAGEAAVEIEAARKALHVRQRRPDRGVEFLETEIDCDEAVAAIDTDCGTDEHAVDFDDVRLQHGRVPLRNEITPGQAGSVMRWWTGRGSNIAIRGRRRDMPPAGRMPDASRPGCWTVRSSIMRLSKGDRGGGGAGDRPGHHEINFPRMASYDRRKDY